MGTICRVGDIKKHPDGKRYRKAKLSKSGHDCTGCSHFEAGCPLPCVAGKVDKPIEDGGSECSGSIWKLVPSNLKKHLAKAPTDPKHVWQTKFLHIHPKSTRAKLSELLLDSVNQINVLGTENAKLKNQIALLKKKGSK